MNCHPVCPTCPLCREAATGIFYEDHRVYYRCSICCLVFVSPAQRLSASAEKAEYDRHQNSPQDPRYRQFLQRLFDPLAARLAPTSQGLDFGSGPGPTLSVMFQESGHRMNIFDPFYAPDEQVFQQQYDFITASEVVEHLHDPARDLERLWSCLKSGGLLGIMTKRVIDREAFARWHYKADPTHVCFFALETFVWLAERWHADLAVPGNDVVVFTRPSS